MNDCSSLPALRRHADSGAPWHQAPTVRQLLRPLEPVGSEVCCQTVLDRLLLDPEIFGLPVIDARERPVTLIDRAAFVEFFSQRFSQDVFGRRPLGDLLSFAHYRDAAPLVVEESCTVDEAARLIIAAGMRHMVTGFMISRGGRYVGVANGRDLLDLITQQKQAELYHLAHYDSLTGIPNRALLADRMSRAGREADRRGRLVALLFIDVDRFKQINDSLGHSAGDEVLRQIAIRLGACAREVDTLARLAGDEFVILLEDLGEADQVGLLAERILAAMALPIDLPGHPLTVTVSLGSAVYPLDDAAIEGLLHKADAAMYEAKALGRQGYCRYTADMPGTPPASMGLERELRRAIDGDELALHYQPQLGLADGAVIGLEALVRWRHPQRGLIPPLQFIPMAEECGLIVALGEWVVRAALAQSRRWQDLGLPALPVSVNISALQFRQRGFAAFLAAQLAEHRIAPGLLELELTESVLMKNVEEVLQTLQEIKALGVRLAIDDFGTGFSSLSYLRRFPIDRLKIDQSFVRDIEKTAVNESIARALVALADSLSLEILAEGIEKPAEAAVLRALNCSQGQGYLFSRPLAADELAGWLNARPAPPPAEGAAA